MKSIHGAVDAVGKCATWSKCGKNLQKKGEIHGMGALKSTQGVLLKRTIPGVFRECDAFCEVFMAKTCQVFKMLG